MNKIIVGVLVVIILGGAYYWYTTKQPAMSGAQGTATSGKIVPKWTFANVPQANESDAPKTKVTLTLGDKVYDAGTYEGSCSEIGTDGGVDGKGLLAGEASGIQCWYAGGGDEVGLFFEEDGSMSLKHGELSEPDGEGSQGFRGNFKDVTTI